MSANPLGAWSRASALVLALANLALPQARAQGPYENPPILEAARRLPEELLSGPRHAVDPEVPTDGFSTYFTVHSDYGVYRTASKEEAAARIHEIYAIAALDGMKRYQLAGEAAIESVKQPFLAVKNVVTEPTETAHNLGEGLGRWVQRGKLTLRKTARKAGKKTRELAQDAKESYEDHKDARREVRQAEQEVVERARTEGKDPEAALAEARQTRTAEEGSRLAAESDIQRNQERAQKVKGVLLKATYRHIGYDRARRQLAGKLEVDPYSSNLPLQQRLDEMAWALWSGSFGTGFVLPSNELLSSVQDINKLVWESHPKDLEVRNRKLVKSFGAKQAEIDTFFENPFYGPSDRTHMADDLEGLQGVANRDHLFRLAGAVDNGLLAGFYRRAARMLARTHIGSPLERLIRPTEKIVVALTREGELLLVLPVDHLAWTESLDSLAKSVESGCREASFEGQVILVLAGDLTETARRRVEGLGWRVDTFGLPES